MGNSSSREREARDPAPSAATAHGSAPASSGERAQAVYHSHRAGRGSRSDLSFLGLGSAAGPTERRETRAEREARKLEKERVLRVKERERSLKSEHVDGGYLVTMGVYVGTEDFDKPVVRKLMVCGTLWMHAVIANGSQIDRRIAPFWRGLDDHKDEWAEHQLVAAGRGLPIPPADEIPSEDLMRPLSSNTSNGNINGLTVPIATRTQSNSSEASSNLPSLQSALNSSLPSDPQPAHSSPFRPRSKTLASLTTSRNPSSDMVQREIQLPKDPYVNGQAIEVAL